MNPILSLLNDSLFHPQGLQLTAIAVDGLAVAYEAADFKLDNRSVKFRKAKLTPKKNGQFVTLWKRDKEGISTAYHTNDEFDCCIIVTLYKQEWGFFLFPKAVLAAHGYISTNNKEGKRGFRVYPDWDMPASTQASKTKNWQAAYFINMNKDQASIKDKFNSIFKTINQ